MIASTAFSAIDGTWNSFSLTVPEEAPFVTNSWVADARHFTVDVNGDLRDITTDPNAGVTGSVNQLGGAALFQSEFIDAMLYVDESEAIMSGMFRFTDNAVGLAVCLKAPESNDLSQIANSTWNYIEFRYPTSVSFIGGTVSNSSDTPFQDTGTLTFDAANGFILSTDDGPLSGTIAALPQPGKLQIQATIPGEGTLTIPVAVNAAYDTLGWVIADSESLAIFIAVRRASNLVAADITGYWDIANVEVPSENIFFQVQAQFRYEQRNGFGYLRGNEKSYIVFNAPERGQIIADTALSAIVFDDDDDDDGPDSIFINAGKTWGVTVEESFDGYQGIILLSKRPSGSGGVADARLGGLLLEIRPDQTGYDLTFDIESSNDLSDWKSVYQDTIVVPAQGDKQFLRLIAQP